MTEEIKATIPQLLYTSNYFYALNNKEEKKSTKDTTVKRRDISQKTWSQILRNIIIRKSSNTIR